MSQLRETLIRNADKYHINSVADYEVEKKWHFLQLDPMVWNNFIDAKAMRLTNEADRTVYDEHISSIEMGIHGAARIYSITLNQCYKRKKKLEFLAPQLDKYQNIIEYTDVLISEYREELVKIKNYSAEIGNIKYPTDYTENSTLYRTRKNIERLEQTNQQDLKLVIKFLNYLIEILMEAKNNLQKETEVLLSAIEKIKNCFEEEFEIMQKALKNMKQMRENYLYSFVHYNCLLAKDSKKDDIHHSKQNDSNENENIFDEEDAMETI